VTTTDDADLHVALRDQLRIAVDGFLSALDGLTTEQVNRNLGPETNSIAVLVAHTVETGRAILHDLLDDPIARDRTAAFRITDASSDDVRESLVGWRDEMDDLAARALAGELGRTVKRYREATQAWWLLQVLAHTREHAAQAALTRQLVLAEGADA
jgi:hypothetical protein